MRYLILDKDGRAIREYISASGPPSITAGQTLLECEFGVGRLDDYHDGSGFATPHGKPSTHHVFDYSAKKWVDPRTPQTEWAAVRQKRDAMLRDTDFTQLNDSPKNKQAWAAYRQELRDITKQADPFNVAWPTPPSN